MLDPAKQNSSEKNRAGSIQFWPHYKGVYNDKTAACDFTKKLWIERWCQKQPFPVRVYMMKAAVRTQVPILDMKIANQAPSECMWEIGPRNVFTGTDSLQKLSTANYGVNAFDCDNI